MGYSMKIKNICIILILITGACTLFTNDYLRKINTWYIENTRNMEFEDNILIIQSSDHEILFFNGNDSNPDILSKFYIDTYFHSIPSIHTYNNYALISSFMSLYFIDISDYNNPSMTGSLLMPDSICSICIHEDTAYVSVKNSGIYVILIKTDGTMSILSGQTMHNNATKMMFYEGRLFFSDVYGYLNIIHYRNNAWENIYQIDPLQGDTISDFIIENDTLFVASQSIGLRLIDVSDAYSPKEKSIIMNERIRGAFIDKQNSEIIVAGLQSIAILETDISGYVQTSQLRSFRDTIQSMCAGNDFLYIAFRDSVILLE